MLARTILLALGAVFVLMGAIVLYAWFGQVRTNQTAAEAPAEVRVSILAAAHSIAKGTLLRQDDVKPKELAPGELLKPGNLVSGQETDLLGALSRRDFSEGEALLASEFVKPGDRNFLAGVLKPGYRAITISVDAAQSVAGLALPGDFVDVILVQSFDEKLASDPRRRTASETMLRSVRVIAVDQTMNPPPAGMVASIGAISADSRIPRTITLEVDERQAEKLLVASKLGSFQLSLLPLEVAAADPRRNKRGDEPTWASDVSLALDELSQAQPTASSKPGARAASPCPPATGSTIEKSVRCAPSTLIYYRPPGSPSEPVAAKSHDQTNKMRVAPAVPAEGATNE